MWASPAISGVEGLGTTEDEEVCTRGGRWRGVPGAPQGDAGVKSGFVFPILLAVSCSAYVVLWAARSGPVWTSSRSPCVAWAGEHGVYNPTVYPISSMGVGVTGEV
jgi:hypothetical protein